MPSTTTSDAVRARRRRRPGRGCSAWRGRTSTLTSRRSASRISSAEREEADPRARPAQDETVAPRPRDHAAPRLEAARLQARLRAREAARSRLLRTRRSGLRPSEHRRSRPRRAPSRRRDSTPSRRERRGRAARADVPQPAPLARPSADRAGLGHRGGQRAARPRRRGDHPAHLRPRVRRRPP